MVDTSLLDDFKATIDITKDIVVPTRFSTADSAFVIYVWTP